MRRERDKDAGDVVRDEQLRTEQLPTRRGADV